MSNLSRVSICVSAWVVSVASETFVLIIFSSPHEAYHEYAFAALNDTITKSCFEIGNEIVMGYLRTLRRLNDERSSV